MTHREILKREIFVLADTEQYCYINQSVNAARKARGFCCIKEVTDNLSYDSLGFKNREIVW